MVTRSTLPIYGLYFFNHSPIQGRASCPRANGNTNQRNRSNITGPSASACPVVCNTTPIHSGVSTTPSKLDNVALNTAPPILPRAAAVKATDEDTVEGKAQR